MKPKITEKQTNVRNSPAIRAVHTKPGSSDLSVRQKSVDLHNPDSSNFICAKKEADAKQMVNNVYNNVHETSDKIMNTVNSLGQSKINCRLCDKDITGKECQLLYDHEENVETRLGRKINIIINSTVSAHLYYLYTFFKITLL